MKRLLQPRILILIIALILSLLSIFGFPPKFSDEGIAIEGIHKSSAAEIAGMRGPEPGISPVNKELILSVNGIAVNSLSNYYSITKNFSINESVIIETNKGIFPLIIMPKYELEETGEFETIEIVKEVNGTNVTEELEQEIIIKKIVGVEDLGIIVGESSTNNIRKGLDLSGGTRVILRPQEAVDDEVFETMLESIKQRLNVYGLADIQVRPVESGILGDGERFISVEIPGPSQKEIIDLLTKQGKFESKIGEQVVFSSGDDIKNVCRTGDCAMVNTCVPTEEGAYCNFRFSITLSAEAAERQAAATKNLNVFSDGNSQYLSEDIILILDGEIVDQLKISSNLRGVAETEISITGSGSGRNEVEAKENAIANMKQLQTLLETGNLPVKLEIVKTDRLSPSLGKEFLSNIMLIGLLVVLAVITVVFLRYRQIILTIPIAITIFSEVIIILGIASFIKWNIDLAAVAGILIAIGTGVDHQIVILDESFTKGKIKAGSWKDKMKKAFFIIMAAYFTTLVAMLPLLNAGAGLLKGFAITTIIGVSIGVFITRPAFAKMIEMFTNQ